MPATAGVMLDQKLHSMSMMTECLVEENLTSFARRDPTSVEGYSGSVDPCYCWSRGW
jgi:hypothetical protein